MEDRSDTNDVVDFDRLGDAFAAVARFDEEDDAQAAFDLLVAAARARPDIVDYALAIAYRAPQFLPLEAVITTWVSVRERFPGHAEGYVHSARVLREAQRWPEAEQMLTQGLQRFPDDVALLCGNAYLAMQQEDWATAGRHWDALLVRYPDNAEARNGRAVTDDRIWRAQQSGTMARFETLGSGCEFGLVQRYFDTELISLMRWGAIPPRGLTKGLDEGFANLGNPEHTELLQVTPQIDEYLLREKSYMFEMHTFTKVNDSEYDSIKRQLCRQAKFLVRNLIDDLHDGPPRKIYIYKGHEANVTDEEAFSIHRSLQRYNSQHNLVCVRLQDAIHLHGSVVMARPGLIFAYIDRLSPTADANEINFVGWHTICSNVLALLERNRHSRSI